MAPKPRYHITCSSSAQRRCKANCTEFKSNLQYKYLTENDKNKRDTNAHQRGTWRQFNKQRLKICFVASSLLTAICASTYCFQNFAYTSWWQVHVNRDPHLNIQVNNREKNNSPRKSLWIQSPPDRNKTWTLFQPDRYLVYITYEYNNDDDNDRHPWLWCQGLGNAICREPYTNYV